MTNFVAVGEADQNCHPHFRPLELWDIVFGSLRVTLFPLCTKRYSDELVPTSVGIRDAMKLRVH